MHKVNNSKVDAKNKVQKNEVWVNKVQENREPHNIKI